MVLNTAGSAWAGPAMGTVEDVEFGVLSLHFQERKRPYSFLNPQTQAYMCRKEIMKREITTPARHLLCLV